MTLSGLFETTYESYNVPHKQGNPKPNQRDTLKDVMLVSE